jgi:hypothetical protein
MAGRVRLISQKAMVEVVAKIPGVRDAVRGEAGEIFWKATANLARHRRTGRSSVEIDNPSSYDHWGVNVYLVDPDNALAIETGHYLKTASGFPIYVRPLNILRSAAGLV